MTSTTKFHLITEQNINKYVEVLEHKINLKGIDIRQYIADILLRNFKIEKAPFAKIVIGMAILIAPSDELFKSIIPVPSDIEISKYLDKNKAIQLIASVATAESERYRQFVSSKEYKPASMSELKTVTVDTYSYQNTLKECIEQSAISVQNIDEITVMKPLETLFEYTSKDYEHLLTQYFLKASKLNKYKHIDYKHLKKQCVLPQVFNIQICKQVLAQMLDDEVLLECTVNNGDLKYMLKSTNIQYANKLHRCANYQENNTYKYELKDERLTIADLNDIIDTAIKTTDNNGRYDYLQFEFEKFVVTINCHDYRQIDVRSKEFSYFLAAKQVENQLIKKLKKSNPIKVSFKKKQTLNLYAEGLEGRKVEIGLQHLELLTKGTKIKLKSNQFMKLMPLYDKQKKLKYLDILHHDEACIRYDANDLLICSKNKVNINQRIKDMSCNLSFDYIGLAFNLEGDFDPMHYIHLLDKLFIVQVLQSKNPNFNYVVEVDVSKGVKIVVELFTEETKVEVIDANVELGYELETKIKSELIKQLKKQTKVIKKYQ